VNAREAHPIAADEQTDCARSEYWLEHSEGFQVFGPDGRIGSVALVLSSDDGVGGLVLHTGLLRTRSVFVPAHEVGSVLPRRQRLELLRAPRAPQARISDLLRELLAMPAAPSPPQRDQAAPVALASDAGREGNWQTDVTETNLETNVPHLKGDIFSAGKTRTVLRAGVGEVDCYEPDRGSSAATGGHQLERRLSVSQPAVVAPAS
jgi:hypothetical protein